MMQQECMAAVVPDAGAILNSVLTAQAPAERGYQLAAQRALGAAGEDSPRPMAGIICIAIPVSILCWTVGYYLLHGLLHA